MSSVVVPVSQIDRRTVEAHHDLAAARSALAQSPSGAAITACKAVEARLDRLLDVRSDRMTARAGRTRGP